MSVLLPVSGRSTPLLLSVAVFRMLTLGAHETILHPKELPLTLTVLKTTLSRCGRMLLSGLMLKARTKLTLFFFTPAFITHFLTRELLWTATEGLRSTTRHLLRLITRTVQFSAVGMFTEVNFRFFQSSVRQPYAIPLTRF